MMSSAIPARLLFQCGHAALVTLPRVKGETTAQRNERIAREKNEALARQCDFCGPTVDVAVQPNGNHLEVAEVLAAEPVVVAGQPATLGDESLIVAEASLPIVDGEPIEALPDDREAPVVLVVEEPVELVEEYVVVDEEPVVVVEDRVDVHEEPVVIVEERVVIIEKPAPRRRRAPTPRPVSSARGFAVEYRLERVLRAADIRDALRQAEALGARDILAIDRIND